MKIEEMIRDVQSALGVEVDGKAGPDTWSAIHRALVKREATVSAIVPDVTAVDARSESVIATLLPEVRPYARALVERARTAGITIKVISGLRTYAEQDELYSHGRTKPQLPKVTNARGGQSNHNFGIAFDIGVFEDGEYLDESPKYKVVGVIGQQLGLEWGGNWKTIVDQPHFQLRPSWAHDLSEGELLAQLRNRHEQGVGVYA